MLLRPLMKIVLALTLALGPLGGHLHAAPGHAGKAVICIAGVPQDVYVDAHGAPLEHAPLEVPADCPLCVLTKAVPINAGLPVFALDLSDLRYTVFAPALSIAPHQNRPQARGPPPVLL